MGMDDVEGFWVVKLEAGCGARLSWKMPSSSRSPGPVCSSSSSEIRLQMTSKVASSSKTLKVGVAILQELQRFVRWSCGEGLQ